MRLMSVSLTKDAVYARTKTVTRRLGWKFAKVGDTITLCEKVMGRRKGEPLVKICDVKLVDVRRVQLDTISEDDVTREGFRGVTPGEFVDFFCQSMKCSPTTEVTRIEWEYV